MDVLEAIGRIRRGEALPGDLESILSATDGDAEAAFSEARRARDAEFGRRAFLYGFVYFSTHCRNDCAFCYFRRSSGLPRYRKSADEVLSLSASLKDAGVNLVDLTMGEDPVMCADGHREAIGLVRRVKEEVGTAVMASPGAMSEQSFADLAEAGADWFACYQETYDRGLFSRLRLGQSFDHRMDQRAWARKAGMLAEDGIMVGIGESVEGRAESLRMMGGQGCEQIRAMTFIPQEGTPMAGSAPPGFGAELLAIAAMRIMFPDRLIPASLDVEGIAGLRARLDAGANVVTSIVPPRMDLAGVAQHELDIENGNRSVRHVAEMLDEMGMRAATDAEYGAALSRLRSRRGRL
ncbi:MAG: methylornithine synthase PylB [Candidatus Methanoplasma sp.]|jgi:methylornithine synthase|nr:methylornithine synthase PylB [Candidatus Methanoplasma sp.]